MRCSEARAFLSRVNDRQEPLAPIPQADLDYLAANGYLLRTTKDDYDRGVTEVGRISQMVEQENTERAETERMEGALRKDEGKEHSFTFRFEGKEEKDAVAERVESETAALSRAEAEVVKMDANVNALIQEKSMIDRMVAYDGGYLSLTGLGTVVLNDLSVRDYRSADEEFQDFTAEIKATYAELRAIGERASSYAFAIKSRVPDIEEVVDYTGEDAGELAAQKAEAESLMWGTAIGLAKLRGDATEVTDRFQKAIGDLWRTDSTTPNKLMAAEILTALGGQDMDGLESSLRGIDDELRSKSVPKELSTGIAAAIMAGKRYDGTYPTDNFERFRQVTKSYESAAILAVMNVPFDGLSAKFQKFRSTFASWGYTASEDTEVASAFLAIGELGPDEIQDKLKYIVEQLGNYLQYPLVAAAILASIPVFEAHEVLDLMEKAVTLLGGYTPKMERSAQVALAVRMIHGVRNELVKKIDPTAAITPTPVQFTYAPHPGLFLWYRPVIIAHSCYHATFSGMGGFHPAHYHGVGGFAG